MAMVEGGGFLQGNMGILWLYPSGNWDFIVIYWDFMVIYWDFIVIYWDFIVIYWDFMVIQWDLNGILRLYPSKIRDTRPGKRLHKYGKSPFLMGNPTINGHFQ